MWDSTNGCVMQHVLPAALTESLVSGRRAMRLPRRLAAITLVIMAFVAGCSEEPDEADVECHTPDDCDERQVCRLGQCVAETVIRFDAGVPDGDYSDYTGQDAGEAPADATDGRLVPDAPPDAAADSGADTTPAADVDGGGDTEPEWEYDGELGPCPTPDEWSGGQPGDDPFANNPFVGFGDEPVLAAGRHHTCAVLSDSRVLCWGRNDDGQLGDGSTAMRQLTPVEVTGLSGQVQQMAAGRAHTCALQEDGDVYCWGDNTYGQLGDGTDASSPTPVVVQGLGDVEELTAGYDHNCAVTVSGRAHCWGVNDEGQLGDGTTVERMVPTQVSGVSDAVYIAAGDAHSCARRDDGSVHCWGSNAYGQLGDESLDDSATARPVSQLDDATVITAGARHSCARRASGRVVCWGANYSGQVTRTFNSDYREMVPTESFAYDRPRYSSVFQTDPALAQAPLVGGAWHTCAVVSPDYIVCRGDGDQGQLGTGWFGPSTGANPAAVWGLRGDVVALAAGGNHTCAIHSDDSFRCWGGNLFGQLGTADTRVSAVPRLSSVIPDLAQHNDFVKLAGGGKYNCGILRSGRVRCWSDGRYDPRLGAHIDHMRTSDGISVLLGDFGPVREIAAPSYGSSPTCAITDVGDAYCWGGNSDGTIGDGTQEERIEPTAVASLPPATQLAVGGRHTCASLTDGTVRCWGYNGRGRLGDGTTEARLEPVSVTGLSDVVDVAAGRSHTCAALTDGSLHCWGSNNDFEEFDADADSSSYYYSNPTPVPNMCGVREVTVGENHTCVLRHDGSVICWGYDTYGYLGPQRPIPRPGESVGAVMLDSRRDRSCAVLADGRVYCWGVERGSSNWFVQPLTDLDGARSIAIGQEVCAIMEDDSTQCLEWDG